MYYNVPQNPILGLQAPTLALERLLNVSLELLSKMKHVAAETTDLTRCEPTMNSPSGESCCVDVWQPHFADHKSFATKATFLCSRSTARKQDKVLAWQAYLFCQKQEVGSVMHSGSLLWYQKLPSAPADLQATPAFHILYVCHNPCMWDMNQNIEAEISNTILSCALLCDN